MLASSSVKKNKLTSKVKWMKAFLSVYLLAAGSQKSEAGDLTSVS